MNCFHPHNDLSFEADAETLSLFTSLDFDIDEAKVDAGVVVQSGVEVSVDGDNKLSLTKADENVDHDDVEDDDDDEEEETAEAMVHSVQQNNGKQGFLLPMTAIVARW